MSMEKVEIVVTFGEEVQKTIEIGGNIKPRNLSEGLNVNLIDNKDITVQVKGVASVIDKLDLNQIDAYVDLTGLGVGEHEVEIKIDNNNPLVSYVVSSKLKIKISWKNYTKCSKKVVLNSLLFLVFSYKE